jgi:hypothetical protein
VRFPNYERVTTPDLWDELRLGDGLLILDPVEPPVEEDSIVDFEQRHGCPFDDLREAA